MYKSGDAARAVTPLAHAQRALDPPRAHAAEQRDLQFGVDRRLGPANHLSALKLAIFRGIIRAKPSFRRTRNPARIEQCVCVIGVVDRPS